MLNAMAGPFAVPDSWEEARELLLPVVRPATSPAAAWQAGAPTLVRQPLAPFLYALLVIDQPHGRVYVTPRHLDRWKIHAATAFTTAWARLDPVDGLQRRTDGIWEVASEDSYESSRLLLPGWMAAFSSRVAGTPVAIVPHARCLLLGGTADEAQLDTLLTTAAREWRDGGDPISPVLYVAGVHGRLEPFIPPPGQDWLAASALAAQHALAQREYSRLDDLVDPYLARFEVGLRATEGDQIRPTYTFARWVRGTAPRLPDVDYAVLTDANETLVVPLATLIQHCKLHRDPETDGLCWVTHEWPDDAAQAALRDASIPPDRL